MATFELNCIDCQFDTVVEGTVEDVYDRVEAHRTDMGASPAEHNVDFERVYDTSPAGTTPE